MSDSLPELTGLADALDGLRVILAGELVARPEGKVGLLRLGTSDDAHRAHGRLGSQPGPVTFVAFDLLHLDGQDLTGLPLVERKRLLDELHLVGPPWVVNACYPGDGDKLFQVCSQPGHEGVVANRLDAVYLPGKRSRTWLKHKTPNWKRDHAPRRRPRVAA